MMYEFHHKVYSAEGEVFRPILVNMDNVISIRPLGEQTIIEFVSRDDESLPYITVKESYSIVKWILGGHVEKD